MNCRPPTSYVAGTPSEPVGRSLVHATLPESRSYARTVLSDAVATNTRPPAVTSGPPLGMCDPESDLIPSSEGAVTPPCGTRHLISPVFKSYAVISDQGGPIAVMPFVGLCMKSYGDVYRTGPLDAASFAAAINCAFCSAVTIGLAAPPPRAPPAVGSSLLRISRISVGMFFVTT